MMLYVCFFFFKKKTAYEMRISDWSSDVCSSDLAFNQLARKAPALAGEYTKQNVKLLYALGFSENTIWSSKPIKTVEDLKGMRIRSVMSIADALKILGAVPVSMGFGDAVGALQRQVIDGFSSAPFLTSISVGLHEFAPYVSDGGGMGVYAVSSTSINLDTWKRLSPAVQKPSAEVAAKVDRKSVVAGKSFPVRVDPGGR